jgi:outer membrane protein TolC
VSDSATTPSSWWASFNDVELDSLIQRAAQSNLDLRVAEARLREARAVRQGSAADFWPTVDASGSAVKELESKKQPFFGELPLPANFPFEYSVTKPALTRRGRSTSSAVSAARSKRQLRNGKELSRLATTRW